MRPPNLKLSNTEYPSSPRKSSRLVLLSPCPTSGSATFSKVVIRRRDQRRVESSYYAAAMWFHPLARFLSTALCSAYIFYTVTAALTCACGELRVVTAEQCHSMPPVEFAGSSTPRRHQVPSSPPRLSLLLSNLVAILGHRV